MWQQDLTTTMAVGVAIAALRAQQERENPRPLMPKELKERVGKPYYHVELNYSDKWWGIMRKEIAEHPKDYHYGDWWLAYDHEPKEG